MASSSPRMLLYLVSIFATHKVSTYGELELSKARASSEPEYCSISFKSTLGMTRDLKNQFDISTTVKFWCDTSEIFDIESKILPFLGLTGNLSPV
jgi:hypothetical protein